MLECPSRSFTTFGWTPAASARVACVCMRSCSRIVGSRYGPQPGLQVLRRRSFTAETCAMDKGYDVSVPCDACEEHGSRPAVPLRQTTTVKRGDDKRPPASTASGDLLDQTPNAPASAAPPSAAR